MSKSKMFSLFYLLYPVTPEDVYKSTYNTDFSNVKLFASAGRLCSYYGLKDPKVQELIRSKNLDFDLVINEQMFQESWLMFGYKFNAPLITISKQSSVSDCFQFPIFYFLYDWFGFRHLWNIGFL